MKHSVTKLSHLHFVSNLNAKKRLIKLGEYRNKIFTTGSPDIDLMIAKNLPSLNELRKKYDLEFKNYILFLFHPFSTQISELNKQMDILIKSVKTSNQNAVVIYPNNDPGFELIINKIKKISVTHLNLKYTNQ